MVYFLVKIFVSALMIALISEIAKRSDAWGGLIAALPVTTILVILWMHFEGAGDAKIAKHMGYNLLYVLPTLPMFVLFPFVISRFGFWWALALSLLLTVFLLILFNWFLNKFGLGIL